MNTKSICLEEVSVEEFQKLEDFWGDRRKIRPDSVHSRLRNPLMADTYIDLFHAMREMDYAHQICVRKNTYEWVKRLVGMGISDDELKRMAKLAAQDKVKRNYLELKLRDPAVMDLRCAILEFTEMDGGIVSYKARVPYMHRHLFTINSGRAFAFNNAVWVPE